MLYVISFLSLNSGAELNGPVAYTNMVSRSNNVGQASSIVRMINLYGSERTFAQLGDQVNFTFKLSGPSN